MEILGAFIANSAYKIFFPPLPLNIFQNFISSSFYLFVHSCSLNVQIPNLNEIQEAVKARTLISAESTKFKREMVNW